ncbi:FG-GAP repeat protein [Pseudooceanicola sp.]|uniref:FG-GAP repeat protein n=1 Tax=Pseudooceanicola sp. TaxID=1914328 RepID=UPI0035C720F9
MTMISRTIAVFVAILSLVSGAQALTVQPDNRGESYGNVLAPSALSWVLGHSPSNAFAFDTFVRTAICRLTTGCGGASGVDLAQSGAFGLLEDGGATYVFDTATGDRLLRLAVDGVDDGFGTSVSVGDDVVAVGGVGLDGDGNPISGAVYLFDRTTGTAVGKFTDPDGTGGSGFGYSVALSGSRLLVGAPSGNGFAYLFDTETGDVLQRLTPPAGLGLAGFGGDVGFVDGFLAVAGDVPQAGGGTTPGGFLFDANTGEFVGQATPGQVAAAFGGGSGITSGGSTANSPSNGLAGSSLPAVPLPAPFMLLFAALGGLALVQRKHV